jgi:hypothetical protein
MKYLLLVCRETSQMDGEIEPDPTDAAHPVATSGTIEVRPFWGT